MNKDQVKESMILAEAWPTLRGVTQPELTEYCPVRGTASLRPAHRLGAIFFNLFLHVHRGEHLVEVGGHTCIPATVTISAVLAGG